MWLDKRELWKWKERTGIRKQSGSEQKGKKTHQTAGKPSPIILVLFTTPGLCFDFSFWKWKRGGGGEGKIWGCRIYVPVFFYKISRSETSSSAKMVVNFLIHHPHCTWRLAIKTYTLRIFEVPGVSCAMPHNVRQRPAMPGNSFFLEPRNFGFFVAILRRSSNW